MGRTIRLTETDINRIIKKVLNENIYENSLYRDITNVISNSNATHEEVIYILNYIINEKETNKRMRSRLNN